MERNAGEMAASAEAPAQTPASPSAAAPAQSPCGQPAVTLGTHSEVQALTEAVASGPQVLGAQSHNFQLYFNSALGSAEGKNVCNELAKTVYVDYQILSSWFGGIQIDSFDLHADPWGTNKVASHWDCGARDIHFDHLKGNLDFDRMVANSEIVEVFEANFDGDWDCGNSLGEALSRVLAEAMYPGQTVTNGTRSPAGVWLDSANRPNWITSNDETDQNFDSTGCAALFLNWLRFQLGYRWEDIVGAARQVTDLTAEHLYHQLTGGGAWNPSSSVAWKAFKNFIDSKFPPGTPTSLKTNNPFPFMGSQAWNGWQNLGRPGALFTLNRPASVAARAVNRLDVAATGGDNAVWLLSWDGAKWEPWKSIGGTVTAGSAVVARDSRGFNVYGRATDSTMYQFVHYPLPGGYYRPWMALGGGSFEGDPAAVSWAPYRVDLFARNAGQLVHRYSHDHGSHFTDWESLGHPPGSIQLQGSPSVVSRGPRKIDVVVRCSDGHLWHIGWDSTAWTAWTQVPMPSSAVLPTPYLNNTALTTWWLDRLDLFVVDNKRGLLQIVSTDGGKSWGAQGQFGPPPGTQISTGPTAVSWGPNRIDIFAIGEDQNLWHLFWG